MLKYDEYLDARNGYMKFIHTQMNQEVVLNVCILEPCADVPAAKDTQRCNHLQDQDDCKAISLNDIKRALDGCPQLI